MEANEDQIRPVVANLPPPPLVLEKCEETIIVNGIKFGRKLTLCQWCNQLECDHCRCEGHPGCSHKKGEPCKLPRYRKRRICNPCGTKRRNQQLGTTSRGSLTSTDTYKLSSGRISRKTAAYIESFSDRSGSASSSNTLSSATSGGATATSMLVRNKNKKNKRVSENLNYEKKSKRLKFTESIPSHHNMNDPTRYYSQGHGKPVFVPFIPPEHATQYQLNFNSNRQTHRFLENNRPLREYSEPIPYRLPLLFHQSGKDFPTLHRSNSVVTSSVTSNPFNMKKRCIWCGNYIPLSSAIDLYHYELICNEHQSRCAIVRYFNTRRYN